MTERASDHRTTGEWLTDLGEAVRATRLAQDRTQAEIARAADVSLDAVRGLEAGRGSSLTTLVQVLRALGREDWLATLAPTEATVSPMQLLRERQAGGRRSARLRPRRRAGRSTT